MTDYDVNIQLTPGTRASLAANGFSLFVWRSIAATMTSGQPVICTAVPAAELDSDTIALTFGRDYGVYVSKAPILDFGTISITSLVPLQLGQKVVMRTYDLAIETTIDDGGSPGAITIRNDSTTFFTAGVVQAGPQIRASVALPLFGMMATSYKPPETILLAFSSYPVGSGTILETLRSQGALADMSTASSLSVSFDLNQGWDFGGRPGTIVPINTTLAPLLISYAPAQP